ncbi:MAG: DUF6361 family protein [Acidimicrobiales bacterium]
MTVADYRPQSSLGWLDFDAAASERVGTLLRALDEPGTLDPIGLGPVRDALSQILAPGVSTIQTRLRYFVFLPWIFQRLAEERTTPARFAARLRDHEVRLIDCLHHLGPNHGIQGYTVRHNLSRMPSEAYWGGLRSWGICRVKMSLNEFGRAFSALTLRGPERDDDGAAIETSFGLWAPVPDPPDDFLDADISFELTADEARFIGDQIRHHHPDSLLAVATTFASEAALAEYPWQVEASKLPPRVAEMVRHAKCVAETTLGPQLLYNLLVAERASQELGWDTRDLRDRLAAALDEWVGLMSSDSESVEVWAADRDSFYKAIGGEEAVPRSTRVFVDSMIDAAIADPEGLAGDTAVRSAIRDREIKLKGKRARLGPRSAIETWNGEPFGGMLTFRWPTCVGYLEDLGAVEGL